MFFAVLDIAHHVTIYRGILRLIRAIAKHPKLVQRIVLEAAAGGESPAILELLQQMNSCIQTCANRLMQYVSVSCQ